MAEIQVMIGPVAGLAESPVWDVAQQRLFWVDVGEGMVFRCTADGRELTVWPIRAHISSIAPCASGGLIATIDTCLYHLDLHADRRELVVDVKDGPGFGFNDGKVDRQGRFMTGLVEKAPEIR